VDIFLAEGVSDFLTEALADLGAITGSGYFSSEGSGSCSTWTDCFSEEDDSSFDTS
jgi:hypothetical protein